MLEAGIPKRLDPVRARENSACLLRFDFLHGDVIRYIDGEYVNRDHDVGTRDSWGGAGGKSASDGERIGTGDWGRLNETK